MSMELVKRYAPSIYFDEKEPFYPLCIGYTIFTETSESVSFNRQLQFHVPNLKYIIEYAIYWDFDIQHLYELEHVWVFIDENGDIADCEASFHGRYLKSLKKDRSNIEDCTHVKLYSQPGKHAFSPIEYLFELLPDLEYCTYEGAGSGGLLVTDVGKNLYETSDEINSMVKEYLQKFKFRPTMKFVKYEYPEQIFVPWADLRKMIPELIHKKLREIEKHIL